MPACEQPISRPQPSSLDILIHICRNYEHMWRIINAQIVMTLQLSGCQNMIKTMKLDTQYKFGHIIQIV